MSAKRVSQVLLSKNNRTLGYLYGQVAQQRRILQAVQGVLPENLQKHALHCLISDKKLVLYTRSAAWASQLRFYKKTILDGIAVLTGEAVQGVQIKVLTEQTGVNSRAVVVVPRATTPSAATLDGIQRQSANIADQGLQLALQRLSATLKKRLADK
jgi:hypothetical protein